VRKLEINVVCLRWSVLLCFINAPFLYFCVIQKMKCMQGVIQIDNPNFVKAKIVKVKDVDVRPCLSLLTVHLL